MAVKIRLARWGAKKSPYYHIVASDSRSPRDGKYIETLGKYNPMLPTDDANKIILKKDRITYWLSVGAIATDRVHKILAKNGLMEAKIFTVQTKKSLPKAKALARLKALEEKQKAAMPKEETTVVAE